jgi:hypothetical protein
MKYRFCWSAPPGLAHDADSRIDLLRRSAQSFADPELVPALRNSRLRSLLVCLPRKPNGRVTYFAHYRNLPLASGRRSQIWFMKPDVAYTLSK